MYCDGDLKYAFAYANREIDSLDAVVARNPDRIVKVKNYAELLKAVKQHKIAALLGVEGGHMIENDLANMMDFLYKKYKAEAESIRPPLSLLIDHIDYIVKLVGEDYAGLGSDFDGINLTPQQLDDVTSYPLITKALAERGYSSTAIKKILGGNLLRVLKANETK